MLPSVKVLVCCIIMYQQQKAWINSVCVFPAWLFLFDPNNEMYKIKCADYEASSNVLFCYLNHNFTGN